MQPHSDHRASAFVVALVVALGALFVGLGWAWRWIGDDGFIALRYAKNLADGHGLVFNPGEPPVEGYTQLLWVLLAAGVERLGLEVTTWTAAVELAFATALFALVARTAWRIADPRARGAATATTAVLFALSPTAVVWATGGLGTALHALFVFATVVSLVSIRRGGAWWPAAACATLVTLARFDGLYHLGLAGIGFALVCLVARDRRSFVRGLFAGGTTAACFALQTLWRHATYGDWLPNTARAKVGFGARALERGSDYVVSNALSVPTAAVLLVVLVVVAVRVLARRDEERSRRGELFVVGAVVSIGTWIYPLLVGGDFMPMGRFLLPSVPFLALVAGVVVAAPLGRSRDEASQPRAWHRTAKSAALTLVLLAGWTPALVGHPPTPRAWREAVSFRWGRPYETEAAFRRGVIARAEHWALEGRALAQHLPADASLVRGAVGAVGYYSGIVLYDRFGLTDRRAAVEFEPDLTERVMPGHDRRAPVTFFADREPDYWYSNLVFGEGPGTARYDAIAADPLTERGDVVLFRVFAADGFPADGALMLVRYGVEVPGLVP